MLSPVSPDFLKTLKINSNGKKQNSISNPNRPKHPNAPLCSKNRHLGASHATHSASNHYAIYSVDSPHVGQIAPRGQ